MLLLSSVILKTDLNPSKIVTAIALLSTSDSNGGFIDKFLNDFLILNF